MAIAMSIFVVIHLLCWAITLGTWVAAVRTKQPSPGMAHAAAGALLAGTIAMFFALGAYEISHLWYTLKFVIAAATTACAYVGLHRREETPDAVWYAIPLLIVINVIIAVFNVGA